MQAVDPIRAGLLEQPMRKAHQKGSHQAVAPILRVHREQTDRIILGVAYFRIIMQDDLTQAKRLVQVSPLFDLIHKFS